VAETKQLHSLDRAEQVGRGASCIADGDVGRMVSTNRYAGLQSGSAGSTHSGSFYIGIDF
jgi:hypothetical protein